MRKNYWVFICLFLVFPGLEHHGYALDCSEEVDLGCGLVVTSGTTIDGLVSASSYNCASSWTEPGPERVFYVTTDLTGNIVATFLAGTDPDLAVYILGSCDETDCLAWGPAAAFFGGAPPGRYYIVVESSSTGGAFELQVYAPCTAEYTPTQTPTITVSPILTDTPTPAYTPSVTSTPTNSPSPTPTMTSSQTHTPSRVPVYTRLGNIILIIFIHAGILFSLNQCTVKGSPIKKFLSRVTPLN